MWILLNCCLLFLIVGFFSPATLAKDVYLRDFGALPDDNERDDQSINRAVETCQPGDRLIFEKGTYDLWRSIKISGKENLDVDGNGAVLMLRGFDRNKGGPTFSAIQLTSSKLVTIHGFTVDMDVSPNSAGEIIQVREKSFDVKVFDEFPLTDDLFVDHIMTFHPDGRPNGKNLDLYGNFTLTKTADHILRIDLKAKKNVKQGELLCFYHKVYGGSAIYFGDSSDCTLRDVTINAFAGMGFVASDRSINVTLERYRVERPKNSKRLTSTNADGSKFIFTGGLLTVKDCQYEGMGDDAINVHSSFGQITEIDKEQALLEIIRPHRDGPHQISKRYVLPGDKIEIYDGITLLAKGIATVLKRDDNKITLDALPEDVAVNDLFNNLTMSPRVRISDVSVRRNRARGFLLQTQDVIVENCKISDPTGVGIFVTTDINYWYESGPGKDIIIRNNIIENANNHLIREGAINVKCGHDSGGVDNPAGVHRNIKITGNTIINTSGSGIFVSATDGIEITGNVIKQCSTSPKQDSGKYAVFLKNCKNTNVTDNTLSNGELLFGSMDCQ